MSNQRIIIDSIENNFQWVKKEKYFGWDPYDALNSHLTVGFNNLYLKLFLIQLNKYSILNFRPLLKVEKGIDLKGVALFALAYSKLYKKTLDASYGKELEECLNLIKKRSLKNKYKHDCWASHYFPYISTSRNELQIESPDIIGTSRAIIALVEGYKISKYRIFKDAAIDASNLLLDKFLKKDKEGGFLKYSLTERNNKKILNASAQGLEAFSKLLEIYDDDVFRYVCHDISRFLISKQRDDGSWVYSISENGKARLQYDFHQGYMIDGLLSYLPYSQNKNQLLYYINKAASFYRSKLFTESGLSYYRFPLRYPVDIHNQAQGIITFSKLGFLDCEYLLFANKIALWTVFQMQDESGYFYHQKWPIITNKIPYMRWSQAWMILALATLLENCDNHNDITSVIKSPV